MMFHSEAQKDSLITTTMGHILLLRSEILHIYEANREMQINQKGKQIGYDLENVQLDKDLLVIDNKLTHKHIIKNI